MVARENPLHAPGLAQIFTAAKPGGSVDSLGYLRKGSSRLRLKTN